MKIKSNYARLEQNRRVMQHKSIKESLNGSMKPLMIGGSLGLAVVIGWIFLAGQRNQELTTLKARLDRIEPVVISLQIDGPSNKSEIMGKLESIDNRLVRIERLLDGRMASIHAALVNCDTRL